MLRQSKLQKHHIVLGIVLLVVCALRASSLIMQENSPQDLLVLRSILDIGLLCYWARSLQARVVSKYSRHALVAIACLLIFWFSVRTIKYYFLYNIDQIRWGWYLYYVPMLLIPCCCLVLALMMGADTSQKPPYWISVIFIVSFLLIAIVLTNDLTHFVFKWNERPWIDGSEVHGFMYFIIMFWEVGISFSALIILFIKCRMPLKSKRICLPFIPFFLMCVYILSYAVNPGFFRFLLNDMTAVNCCFIVATIEICILVNLIQVNTGYEELFEYSDFKSMICDSDFNTLLESDGFDRAFLPSVEELLAKHSVIKDGIRTSIASMGSGYVVWQEDVSALNRLIENLGEAKADLEEETDLLAESYALKRKQAQVEELNAIFDEVQKSTENQIILLAKLIEQYRQTKAKHHRNLLQKMAVIGAYIKRRNNLVFLAYKHPSIPKTELALCFKESIAAVSMANISCSYMADIPDFLNAQVCFDLYDFFEFVLELVFDNAQAIVVFLKEDKGIYSLKICVDGFVQEGCLVQKYGKDVFVEQDEDGEYFIRFKVVTDETYRI